MQRTASKLRETRCSHFVNSSHHLNQGKSDWAAGEADVRGCSFPFSGRASFELPVSASGKLSSALFLRPRLRRDFGARGHSQFITRLTESNVARCVLNFAVRIRFWPSDTLSAESRWLCILHTIFSLQLYKYVLERVCVLSVVIERHAHIF